ncbi:MULTISPECIES: BACON domain-containing protein [unclassified Bacteroides]|uniref:BACON domain-containing protein n=1 Tax=unclassified Bacteroides TaxID=2646097 RepID=UPI004063EC28
MTGKKVNILLAYLLPLLIFACTDDKEAPNTTKGNPSLTFVMTKSLGSIIGNTQVYLFDGEGADAGQFRQKVPDITYGADRLTMSVAAGKWDFMLVSADRDISGQVIQPVRGQARSALKMWETHPSGGVLPSMPELRTAYLAGQQVIANQANTATETALLARNAALVKVEIADAGGLDVNGTHTLKLTNVPTTLNWEGGLYPDKNNPAVSTAPMTGTFTVRNKTSESGHQYSDALSFIIPAHKGSDYLNSSPVDTTTSHLKLSVDLACEGGTRFQKTDVVIPRVPRANATLLVRIFLGGKLDVSTDILNWEDKALSADLSQTLLYTDKAEVGLAFKDTIHINTNAPDFTVEKAADADWITSVKKLGNNAVEITANVDTYVDNNPRKSYITVKANNVSKKIPVTQRPDRGTIKVSAKKLQFSPPNPTASLSVHSVGGNWKILAQSPKATAGVSQGTKGDTPVSFTRTSTADDSLYDEYYGDGQVVFKNLTTLDTDTVHLSNLFIGIVDDLIEVAQPITHPDTTCTVDNVKVYGGPTHDLNIISKPDWIHPAPETDYNPATGIFTFVCDREPNEEERYGEIILGHTDDPAYTVKVSVLQDIIVRIPEFNYFVVQFVWNANDVDVKVGFTGNPTSVDVNGIIYNTSSVNSFQDKWVGWSLNQQVNYNNDVLLEWGGDARQGQGETAFFNAPVINSAPYPGQHGVASDAPGLLPRTVTLQVNAGWYNGGGIPMTCNIYAYLGGTMNHVETNFVNQGGTLVYTSTNIFKVVSSGANQYDHICDIVYDRKKHTAKINWTGTVWTRTTRSIQIPMRPVEETSKPHWTPTVVNTYSNGYRGKRE